MSEWLEVARCEDVAPGQALAVTVDDLMLAVVNLDGDFFVVDNICTHAYAILTEGPVVDGQLQCPLHGARFDVRTGAVTAPPAWEPIETYEVRVEGGIIYARL